MTTGGILETTDSDDAKERGEGQRRFCVSSKTNDICR